MKINCLILAVLSAAMLFSACKNSKPEMPEGQPADGDAAEMPAGPAAGPVAETAYDLEALAGVLTGCSSVENFKNGVAAIHKDGEWQYIDKMGHFVDRVSGEDDSDQAGLDEWFSQYESHGQFSEGMCWVYRDYGIGYIDEKGELVIPCQYEWAVDHSPCDFHEGVCPVLTIPERELFSYIDKTGQLAFPGFYSTESSFSEGLAGVRQFFMDGDDVTGTQPGYIDHTGKMVIFLTDNDFGYPFHDGAAKVSNWLDDTAWFIDKSGKKLFDLDMTRFYRSTDNSFSEGLCAICDKEGRWGFFDKTGRSTFDF